MPGTVTIHGRRYCLVPDVRPQGDGRYWANGPTLQSAVDHERRRFLTAADGLWPDDHVVVFEDDLLLAPVEGRNVLYTFPGAMVVPLRTQGVMALATASSTSPAEFLHKVLPALLARMRVSGDQSELRFVIDWDRLQLTRSYEVCAVDAAALLWPQAPLEGWDPYFLAVRHGDLDPEASVNLFRDLELRLVTATSTTMSEQPASVSLNARGNAFVASVSGLPQWMSFGQGGRELGLIPLETDPLGAYRICPLPSQGQPQLRLGVAGRRVFADKSCTLAIDFGTSNSAVAAAIDGATPTVLSFAGAGAVSLTRDLRFIGPRGVEPVDKPAAITDLARSFFPLGHALKNPLPTLLDTNAEFSEGLKGALDTLQLPRLAIALYSDPRELFAAIERQRILQGFKWRTGNDAKRAKKAFIGQLTLVAAWVLRQAGVGKVDRLLLTYPLAFPAEEQDFVQELIASAKSALSAGSIACEAEGQVSESLANVAYARKKIEQTDPPAGTVDVIVDIGGGTTDIGVFQWKRANGRTFAKPLFLDSLRLGGGDLVKGSTPEGEEYPTPGIIERRGRNSVEGFPWTDSWVAAVRGGSTSATWLDVFGQALTLHLEAGRSTSASAFLAEQRISHRLLGLLTFGAAYAATLGLVARARGDNNVPVRVWFAGLGARLFELLPAFEIGVASPEEQARRFFGKCLAEIWPGNGVEIHAQTFGKESVCCGALSADVAAGFGRRTVFWSDLAPLWHWQEDFDSSKVPTVCQADASPLTKLAKTIAHRVGFLAIDDVVTSIARAYSGSLSHGMRGFPVDPAVTQLKKFVAEAAVQ